MKKSKDYLQHITLILLIIVLLISAYSLFQIHIIKKAIPNPISIDEVLDKLMKHPDLKEYRDIVPVNFFQITQQNFRDLSLEIPGLGESYLGNFVVVFNNNVIIYDYLDDIIRLNFPLQPRNTSNDINKINIGND